MHPVGPSSQTTYWFRRVLVVVLAVAVLVTIVWYLASRTSRSSAGQDSPAAAANTSAAPTMTGVLANSTAPSRSTVPSPSPSPPAPTDSAVSASGSVGAAPATDAAPPAATDSPAPAPDAAAASPVPPTEPPPPASTEAAPAPPPPSYDAEGKLLCPDAAVGLAAKVPGEVKSGTNVIIGMVVSNTGAEVCRRDVSGSTQVFTVFGADGTRLWSTADCFPGQGSEVRDLTPGQTLEFTVKWSGTTSAPGCTGDRVPLGPGSYTLIAQLGPVSSPPAAFTVV